MALASDLVGIRPEPALWWITYRPRSLAPSTDPWIDLASGGLLGGTPSGSRPRFPDGELDDLIYLPPVGESERAVWGEWYRRWKSFALIQGSPGEGAPPEGAALVVYDLLRPLLDGDPSSCDLLPLGATVAWPLIAGVTDSEEVAADWLPRLEAQGTKRVRAFQLQLTQPQRRELAERLPESAFAPLFHPPSGQEERERRWAQWIARRGMNPFLKRPAVPLPEAAAAHRHLAGVLLQVGDLWLRLGRSPLDGQAFFHAAREVESSTHDLAGLARDGNLGVLPWLGGRAMEVVRDALHNDSTPLLDALEREYLEGKVAS